MSIPPEISDAELKDHLETTSDENIRAYLDMEGGFGEREYDMVVTEAQSRGIVVPDE